MLEIYSIMFVFKRRTGLTPGQYRDAFPARLYNTV